MSLLLQPHICKRLEDLDFGQIDSPAKADIIEMRSLNCVEDEKAGYWRFANYKLQEGGLCSAFYNLLIEDDGELRRYKVKRVDVLIDLDCLVALSACDVEDKIESWSCVDWDSHVAEEHGWDVSIWSGGNR